MTASPLTDALDLKSLPVPPPTSAATDKLAFGGSGGDDGPGPDSPDDDGVVQDNVSARAASSASNTVSSLNRV